MTPTEIEARLSSQDPRHVEAVKIMTLLILACKKRPSLEDLVARFGGMFSRLLKIEDQVLRDDIATMFDLVSEACYGKGSGKSADEVHQGTKSGN